MIYNLRRSTPLNFNYHELLKFSNNSADTILLLHLHLNFGQEISGLHKIVDELNLTSYPTLDFSFYTSKNFKTKKHTSLFTLTTNTMKLNYLGLLSLPITEEDKVTYLNYVSLLPPYESTKFIPDMFCTEVPPSLLWRKLIKKVKGGLILMSEREGV